MRRPRSCSGSTEGLRRQLPPFAEASRHHRDAARQLHHHQGEGGTWVTKEYQAKSAYAQADLHQALLGNALCRREAHVRDFLASLPGGKREELAAAGVSVTEKKYERAPSSKASLSELATFALHLLSFGTHHEECCFGIDLVTSLICNQDLRGGRSPEEQTLEGARWEEGLHHR